MSSWISGGRERNLERGISSTILFVWLLSIHGTEGKGGSEWPMSGRKAGRRVQLINEITGPFSRKTGKTVGIYVNLRKQFIKPGTSKNEPFL